LDVVCTNEPVLVSQISVCAPFANCDHDSVDFHLTYNNDIVNDSEIVSKRHLWSEGDYDAMRDYLHELDWSQLFTVNFTADEICSAFCDQLDSAIDMFVPAVQVRERRHVNVRKYPRNIRRLMSRKLTLWRVYKKNRTDCQLKQRYYKLAADCREAVKNMKSHSRHREQQSRIILQTC